MVLRSASFCERLRLLSLDFDRRQLALTLRDQLSFEYHYNVDFFSVVAARLSINVLHTSFDSHWFRVFRTRFLSPMKARLAIEYFWAAVLHYHIEGHMFKMNVLYFSGIILPVI
jgi:hypothetical protein